MVLQLTKAPPARMAVEDNIGISPSFSSSISNGASSNDVGNVTPAIDPPTTDLDEVESVGSTANVPMILEPEVSQPILSHHHFEFTTSTRTRRLRRGSKFRWKEMKGKGSPRFHGCRSKKRKGTSPENLKMFSYEDVYHLCSISSPVCNDISTPTPCFSSWFNMGKRVRLSPGCCSYVESVRS